MMTMSKRGEEAFGIIASFAVAFGIIAALIMVVL
jgi:hypothetical protein